MNYKNLLLGLYSETSLHAGTGQNMGVIDLPIQRESHTGWPCVYGSGMKGALRQRAESRNPADRMGWITDAFGPEIDTSGGVENAGALLVSDARLLLLPIRSLTTHFKWVTCPAIIQRFSQDLRRFLGTTLAPIAHEPNDDEAWVLDKGRQNHVHLNEFRFTVQEKQQELKAFADHVLTLMGDDTLKTPLQQRLAVISNDMFSHLCRATPVNAHVRLNENKTVKTGALWFEETLPSDSLLYSGVVVADSRRTGSRLKSADLVEFLQKQVFPEKDSYLQVGGNETVGMGWCRVTTIDKI